MEIVIIKYADFGPVFSDDDNFMRKCAGETFVVQTGFLRPNGFYVNSNRIPSWYFIDDKYVERVIDDLRIGMSQCTSCRTIYPTGEYYASECNHGESFQIELLPGLISGMEFCLNTAFKEIYNV